MATRMQQRRGTANNWVSTNGGDGPILEVGEIGFETDTGKFKIGDGVNPWVDLDYFLDESDITGITGDYVLANTLGQANGVATLDSSGKLTGSQIPGIDELAQDAVDLALVAGTGITKNYNDNANTITISVDTTAIQAKVANVTDTEIGYLDGVTSNVQAQIDGKISASSTDTLLNKTLDLANNTVSGTINQFNTALSDADFATLNGTEILTNQTINSALVSIPVLRSPEERWSVSATAATGTINFDTNTSGILYYTSNASGNWTLNVRGDGSNTLNNMLAINDSITVVFFVTNGATAYYQTAFQIDESSVTPKWQNGTAPTAGNANSIDIYSFTIVKTDNATFTAFGSQTRFA